MNLQHIVKVLELRPLGQSPRLAVLVGIPGLVIGKHPRPVGVQQRDQHVHHLNGEIRFPVLLAVDGGTRAGIAGTVTGNK